MARTLAAFAVAAEPLERRIAVLRVLAEAVAELHARGRVHGALGPSAVVMLEGGGVVIPPVPPSEASLLARAGFDAPEVARGGRPSRRSDAFSLGALAYLVLAGRAPFEAEEPLEAIRLALFADAPPLRIHAPEVPPRVESTVSAMLERRPRRRPEARDLGRVLGAVATATSTPTPTAPRPPHPAPSPPASAGGEGRPVMKAPSPPRSGGEGRGEGVASTATAILRRMGRLARAALEPLPPLQRAGIVAVPLMAIALVALPSSDGALEREVASFVERGDLASARRRLDDADRRHPGDPIVEKLRGDLACARGAAGECVRRYRIALAARPELREDAALRGNARRLLGPGQACGTRRAAAQLLGELRDPEALPALEEARRSSGLFAFLCTGDSIDRAISATRGGSTR